MGSISLHSINNWALINLIVLGYHYLFASNLGINSAFWPLTGWQASALTMRWNN